MFPVLFAFHLLGAAFALPCHVQGCHPNRQYLIDMSYSGHAVSMSWKTAEHAPQGQGCTSVCDTVACPVNGSPGLVVFSANGKTLWNSSQLNSPPLPLFYVDEGLMDCDGHSLVGYYYNGTSRGPPIKIVYPNDAFSITKTDMDIFMLAFSDGMLYTFDILAIPIASIYLKDKVKGVNGTFVPYLPPAIGGETAYVLTYFSPDGCDRKPSLKVADLPARSGKDPALCSEMSTVHRLYAVNNTHLMVPRMNVTWSFEFEVTDELVSVAASPTRGRPAVLYSNNSVFFAAMVKGVGDESRPTVFAVLDAGYKHDPMWTIRFDDPIYALSYFSDSLGGMNAVHQLVVTTVSSEDTLFTTVDPNNGEKQRVVSLHKVLAEDSGLSIASNVYFTVTVTSDIMVAMPSGNLSSPPTLLFGYTVTLNNSTEHMVGSLHLGTNPTLLWHIPTPDGHPVIGQLANYDCDVGKPSEQLVCTTERTIFSIRTSKSSD